MYPDWVNIYTADTVFKAELVIGILNENGIEAVIFNKQDSAYLFGDIQVYVHRNSVVLAKRIIENTKL